MHVLSSRSRGWPCAAAVTALAVLAGCATPSQRLPAGTPVAQVVSDMGEPSLQCQTPEGSQRLVWSGQPFGQASWATNVRGDGTITGVEQVLTDPSFAQLRKGQWNADQVRCMFGPPATITGVGTPGNTQLVWSYAYKQDTVWNSLMHIFFDDAGYVTHLHPGPDPDYDPDRTFGL